ncbi:hypothetical protein MC885_002542, partial [Smutsia gigantea]
MNERRNYLMRYPPSGLARLRVPSVSVPNALGVGPNVQALLKSGRRGPSGQLQGGNCPKAVPSFTRFARRLFSVGAVPIPQPPIAPLSQSLLSPPKSPQIPLDSAGPDLKPAEGGKLPPSPPLSPLPIPGFSPGCGGRHRRQSAPRTAANPGATKGGQRGEGAGTEEPRRPPCAARARNRRPAPLGCPRDPDNQDGNRASSRMGQRPQLRLVKVRASRSAFERGCPQPRQARDA